MKEAYLFKLEIGNYLGKETHYNIVAETREKAWEILFRLAVPEHTYERMTGWHVTYLGSGILINVS